ncbi:MAG: asparagine synthetase B [Bacteroidaceae bacterium]|nr:asparagine synthetase B [Bacteroidaceae bacterium]
MSALLGVVSKQAVDKCILKEMQDALSHRGTPAQIESIVLDSSTYVKYNNLGLAINESARDSLHTIEWNESKSIMLSYFGEIYNEQELREALSVNDDTLYGSRLLLRLYEQLGLVKMLNLIDGAYGFCIADCENQKIYLVRDKLGEKPFYIYQTEDFILFSPEYKAFFAYPKFKPIMNQEAVSEYFVFRYPVGNATWLDGVRNISPGCFLEISRDTISEQVYWQMPKASKNKLSKEQNLQELKRLLFKSIERRTRGLQHVGAQLSGGVDSSLICAVSSKYLHKEVSSYSVTFEGADFDESKYINFVNDQLYLDAHKFDCKPKDFIDNWGEATWYFEAPLNHEGTVTLYPLNKMAKNDIDIILCGDGPDESMAGYYYLRIIDKYHRAFNGLLWKGIQLKAWFKKKNHYKTLEEYFLSHSQYIPDNQVKQLRPSSYLQDLKVAYQNRICILNKHKYHGDFIHNLSNYNLCTYGHDVSMRSEKMAMAAGLNIRSPFLMTELQEFIQTIPSEFLVDYKLPTMQSTKVLLKLICEEEFGAEFTYRPKIGLGIPIHNIFADTTVRQYIETHLLPSIKERNIVNFDYVTSLWDMSKKNSGYNSSMEVLWCVFSFEIWAKMYIDKNPINSK